MRVALSNSLSGCPDCPTPWPEIRNLDMEYGEGAAIELGDNTYRWEHVVKVLRLELSCAHWETCMIRPRQG